jgi:hypothetical protein
MSERFKQVLEDASKRVEGWPEWRKSEALKLSEQTGRLKKEPANHVESQAKSKAAKGATG